MKKLSLILLALGAVLASCSKHDDAPIINPEDAWKYDVNLPVPIQFGSAGTLTKAPVNPVDGKFPGGLSIGVFGVNNNGEYWFADDGKGYLWYGASGAYVAELKTGTGGTLTFNPKQYYPLSSTESYDFYGYYPFKNSDGVTAKVGGATGAVITYNIGNTDVLWAKATATEYTPSGSNSPLKGFNAKYIRAITKGGKLDLMPNLEFNHKLSKITFHATSGTGVKNEAIAITGIDVNGSYNKATFVVASREHLTESPGTDKSGTFIVSANDLKSIPVYRDNGNGTEATSFAVFPEAWDEAGYKADPNPWAVGYSFILPTNAWDTSLQGINLTADIHLAQMQSQEPVAAQTIELPYPAGGYQEGYEYIYRVIVYDAQKVEVTVSVNEWTPYNWSSNDNSITPYE